METVFETALWNGSIALTIIASAVVVAFAARAWFRLCYDFLWMIALASFVRLVFMLAEQTIAKTFSDSTYATFQTCWALAFIAEMALYTGVIYLVIKHLERTQETLNLKSKIFPLS